MNSLKVLTILAILLTAPAAFGVVSMEIAAEIGPQATAQREWLKLLADIGVTNTRVRGLRADEKPRLEDFGTPERPAPKIYAMINRRGELVVPGAKFKLRDREKLADYVRRLDQEGVNGFLAPKGQFDLTKEQFAEVFEILAKPLGEFEQKATLRELLRPLETELPVEIDATIREVLRIPALDAPKLSKRSRGTALALLLRNEGLALMPEKQPGGPVGLRVAPMLGAKETWPVGYKPEQSPRETAPILFEFIPVEIRGFTLDEAIQAMGPRLLVDREPLPLMWDRFALKKHGMN